VRSLLMVSGATLHDAVAGAYIVQQEVTVDCES